MSQSISARALPRLSVRKFFSKLTEDIKTLLLKVAVPFRILTVGGFSYIIYLTSLTLAVICLRNYLGERLPYWIIGFQKPDEKLLFNIHRISRVYQYLSYFLLVPIFFTAFGLPVRYLIFTRSLKGILKETPQLMFYCFQSIFRAIKDIVLVIVAPGAMWSAYTYWLRAIPEPSIKQAYLLLFAVVCLVSFVRILPFIYVPLLVASAGYHPTQTRFLALKVLAPRRIELALLTLLGLSLAFGLTSILNLPQLKFFRGYGIDLYAYWLLLWYFLSATTTLLLREAHNFEERERLLSDHYAQNQIQQQISLLNELLHRFPTFPGAQVGPKP